MPKSDASLNLDAYARVAERIELFYSKFPNGRITTKRLTSSEREVVVKAFIYRRSEETLPSATGLAAERVGDGEINAHSCLENTETSAIGRALANLGFAASRKRPSREEMEKVERAKNSVAYRPSSAAPIAAERAKPLSSYVIASAIHHDVLIGLERAESLGFSPARAGVIRERLSREPVPRVEDLLKLEKRIQAWTIRHGRLRTAR